ncbi:MAG: nucleotide-binding protein [Verrucomicrobia bacterium]|nr:nucleotide-binding protein [Verrucomicrobiota bacterium]
MSNTELIETLIKMLGELPHRDQAKLDAVQRRANMIVRKVFGENSHYLKDVEDISFGGAWWPNMPDSHNDKYWNDGKIRLMNLFNTMLEEVRLSTTVGETSDTSLDRGGISKRVFVVHGHDEAMKQAVARTLEQLGLEPVILHEQPNKGRTIIEKFTDSADVGFAVVLLSPDDFGYSKDQPSGSAKPRARQNVVFELGFFIGKIGRSKVAALYREQAGFEKPSDVEGVAYTAFDLAGNWRFEIVRELKACGYDVDANKLL